MTLDEAIKHCLEVAEKAEVDTNYINLFGETPDELGRTLASCISCANEYRQLAEWLKLLKRILESGDCNECGIKKVCNVRPEWGERVRYNCPMFVREDQILSQ